MSKPAAIDAQVVDICNDRQHKGSIKITLHVPAEAGALLTDILGWPTYTTPVPVAIARLKQQQEETNTATEKPAPTQPPARVPRNRLTTRAAILSKDPMFKQWLREEYGRIVTDDEAADHIRLWCEVESRKEILPGSQAAVKFDLLESAYCAWAEKDRYVEA